MTERTIFFAVLDIPDAAGRLAYLDRACAGDAALRRQVETLLAAHEREGNFLDVPVVDPVSAATRPSETCPEVTGVQQPPVLAAVRAGTPERPDETRAEPAGQLSAEAVAFLSPAREPGSLGRLDHYEVLGVVGRGGMGLVLKGRDTRLHRVVAIKVLAPQLAASGTARQRFAREAQAAAAVRDDHIVTIYGVNEDATVPYLVMEFIAGITLDERIKQGGQLEVKEVLRIGMQAARGLAAAHAQGLIHRDVKPANILLENGVQRVKITDFGLARAADDASITQSGVIAGTPMFMSPEQANAEHVDHRSDLFSLGSVLYTLCTGHPPFRAASTMAVLKRVCEDTPRPIRELKPDVPDWLAAIVVKLLAKDPARRFQSAAEVADLLGQHLAHLQEPLLVARPASVLTEPEPRGRRRLVPLLVAAVLLVAVGGLGAFLALWDGQNRDYEFEEMPVAPFVPRPPLTLEQLAKLPSPLDSRKHEQIPLVLRARAGGGNPAHAPADLIAALADSRFILPGNGLTSWMAQTADGKMLAVPCGNAVVLFDALTGAWLRSLVTEGNNRVYAAAFSPDGQRLALGHWSGNNTISIWEVSTGRFVLTLPGHQNGVLSLAFSPDGKRLISGGRDNQLRIWNAATGDLLRSLNLAGEVHRVAFSPDGLRVAGAATNKKATVWDAASGTALHASPASSMPCVVFSPDGKYLARGNERSWALCDASTFKEIYSCKTSGQWLAFTPDSRTLLSARHNYLAGGTHTVTRWDVPTGKEQSTLQLGSSGGWAVYHLSPDGTTLFAMRCNPPEPFLHVYDAATGKERFPRQGHLGRVQGLAVSPDGRTIASAGQDKTVRLWDLSAWKPGEALPPCRILEGHADVVWSVAFSPDGTKVASASFDRSIILWDVASGNKIHNPLGLCGKFAQIAFSPDGQTVAAGKEDGTVSLWDVPTARRKDTLRLHDGTKTEAHGMGRAVAFSPDGKMLASGGGDSTIKLWDVAGGKELRTLESRSGGALRVVFAPDGRTLASAGTDGTVKLWEVGTGRLVRLFQHGAAVWGVAVSPDGKVLASAGEDGTVKLWDAGTGWALGTLRAHTRQARCVAFSPDGQTLASAGADNIKLWDLTHWRAQGEPPVKALEYGADFSESLAWHPDGRLLASGHNNGTLRLWDVTATPAQCRALRLFPFNTPYLLGVAFTAEGRYLATANHPDGTVYVLRLASR